MRWNFLDTATLVAIHSEHLSEHGGGVGIRDHGLLESALARPINLATYDEHVGLAALAAAYAVGISKNHPFIDGNKRTSCIAMELFLVENGTILTANDDSLLNAMIKLASGNMAETELVDFININSNCSSES